jgi:hypothetical protein
MRPIYKVSSRLTTDPFRDIETCAKEGLCNGFNANGFLWISALQKGIAQCKAMAIDYRNAHRLRPRLNQRSGNRHPGSGVEGGWL